MKTYRIRTTIGLPVVSAVVVGPKHSRKVELIFDSGAVHTEIHIGTLRAIGFDFHDRTPDLSVRGVTGSGQPGFSVQASRLFVLGRRFQALPVAALDFSEWVKEGVDGLLGWDVIQQFHLEMNGPDRTVSIFQ